jgi:3-oxoacyl-[acyl-carrier protein] reductase
MFSNEIDLQGKSALVTGGSRGIGAAIVGALLAEGMTVWTTGRDQERLRAMASERTHSRGSLYTEVCDNNEPADIDRLFKNLAARKEHLYLVVNNAGIGVFGPCEQATAGDWDRVMNANARGAFLIAKRAFTLMKARGGGRIVNISSVVGIKGYADQTVYSASKHALMGWTKAMAREGQPHGIRVSAVCPGGVATDMLAAARPDLVSSTLIQPDDVARAVLYLAREPQTCCTDVIRLRRSGSTPFD